MKKVKSEELEVSKPVTVYCLFKWYDCFGDHNCLEGVYATEAAASAGIPPEGRIYVDSDSFEYWFEPGYYSISEEVLK
jgi:hypothetical protein